jgi:hypothetical protein
VAGAVAETHHRLFRQPPGAPAAVDQTQDVVAQAVRAATSGGSLGPYTIDGKNCIANSRALRPAARSMDQLGRPREGEPSNPGSTMRRSDAARRLCCGRRDTGPPAPGGWRHVLRSQNLPLISVNSGSDGTIGIPVRGHRNHVDMFGPVFAYVDRECGAGQPMRRLGPRQAGTPRRPRTRGTCPGKRGPGRGREQS